MASDFLPPYHPIPRSGRHPQATAAYAWLLDGNHAAARAAIAKLTEPQKDSAMAAAAVLIALAGDYPDCALTEDPVERQWDSLTRWAMTAPFTPAVSTPLRRRSDVRCAWCGEDDCTDRFGHERLDAESEITWRKRARA